MSKIWSGTITTEVEVMNALDDKALVILSALGLQITLGNRVDSEGIAVQDYVTCEAPAAVTTWPVYLETMESDMSSRSLYFSATVQEETNVQ